MDKCVKLCESSISACLFRIELAREHLVSFLKKVRKSLEVTENMTSVDLDLPLTTPTLEGHLAHVE